MKYGALATTGALAGSAPPAGAVDDADGTGDDGRRTTVEGAMFPYQFTPGARFTVLESDLNWRPSGVDTDFRSHVIEYEFAPSLRAFLFTRGDRDLPSDRPLEFGPTQRPTPSSTARSLVGVDVTAID